MENNKDVVLFSSILETKAENRSVRETNKIKNATVSDMHTTFGEYHETYY
jgi:hypothetical protein